MSARRTQSTHKIVTRGPWLPQKRCIWHFGSDGGLQSGSSPLSKGVARAKKNSDHKKMQSVVLALSGKERDLHESGVDDLPRPDVRFKTWRADSGILLAGLLLPLYLLMLLLPGKLTSDSDKLLHLRHQSLHLLSRHSDEAVRLRSRASLPCNLACVVFALQPKCISHCRQCRVEKKKNCNRT